LARCAAPAASAGRPLKAAGGLPEEKEALPLPGKRGGGLFLEERKPGLKI